MIEYINKERNNKGFTLVELVVVIAILGIIGAIAVPRFSNIRASSAVKADAATAQQIVAAARIQETETGVPVSGLTGTHLLDDKYMTVPTPQSAPKGSFTLSRGEESTTEGGQYTVTWKPKTGITELDKEQTVKEGEAFELAAP